MRRAAALQRGLRAFVCWSAWPIDLCWPIACLVPFQEAELLQRTHFALEDARTSRKGELLPCILPAEPSVSLLRESTSIHDGWIHGSRRTTTCIIAYSEGKSMYYAAMLNDLTASNR